MQFVGGNHVSGASFFHKATPPAEVSSYGPSALLLPEARTVTTAACDDENMSKKRRRLLPDCYNNYDDAAAAILGSSASAADVVAEKKPKRPLSAYNLFFRHQRVKSIQVARKQDMDKASSAGFDESRKGAVFQNLAKHVGRMWRDLPADEKAPFEERAAEEKRRYDEEMAAWRALRGCMGLVRAVSTSSPSLSNIPPSPYRPSASTMTWSHTPPYNASFATIAVPPSTQMSPSAVAPLLPEDFFFLTGPETAPNTASNFSAATNARVDGNVWCLSAVQEGSPPHPPKETAATVAIDTAAIPASTTTGGMGVGSRNDSFDTSCDTPSCDCAPLPFLLSSPPSPFAEGKMANGSSVLVSCTGNGTSTGASGADDDRFWNDSDVRGLLQLLEGQLNEYENVGL